VAKSRALINNVCLEAVLEELRRTRGLDLSNYRRATLERRLAARMVNLRLQDFGDYLPRLRSAPSECDRLVEAILIKVSSFFWDLLVFEPLAQRISPSIMGCHWQDWAGPRWPPPRHGPRPPLTL
jgi:two-component system CheB/CheR fusion protein